MTLVDGGCHAGAGRRGGVAGEEVHRVGPGVAAGGEDLSGAAAEGRGRGAGGGGREELLSEFLAEEA